MKSTRRQWLAGALVSSAALYGAGALAGAPAVHTASRTRRVRAVTQLVPGHASRDGAGVELRRLLGGPSLSMLDPFLMLDEMRSRDPADFIAGFPTHPHRGFETVTLMLEGEVTHEDSAGNRGVIRGGGVQWMTAGRGILHSEMPRASEPGGELWGYQLWVNLPAREKMRAPRYQELTDSAFAPVGLGDAAGRLLAGRVGTRRGPIEGISIDPLVLDISAEAGALLTLELPPDHAAFFYVAQGSLRVPEGPGAIEAGQSAVLGAGDEWLAEATSASRVLFFAGQPLREPVARRGPFVMNTEAELRQAVADYRSGRLVGG